MRPTASAAMAMRYAAVVEGGQELPEALSGAAEEVRLGHPAIVED